MPLELVFDLGKVETSSIGRKFERGFVVIRIRERGRFAFGSALIKIWPKAADTADAAGPADERDVLAVRR